VWKSDSFALGRYEAIASYSYGADDRKTITSMTSFWVLPLKPILMLLGGMLGIVILLYVLIRVYIKRKITANGGFGER